MPILFAALAVVGSLALFFHSPSLDARLTGDQVNAIRWALAHETDSASLKDFGDQCASNNLPLAAAALHARALKLRGGK